jgi:hypothetical protein
MTATHQQLLRVYLGKLQLPSSQFSFRTGRGIADKAATLLLWSTTTTLIQGIHMSPKVRRHRKTTRE